jgi:regulator of replication initiation timing
MAKTLRSIDLGAIDRLEEKVRLLVALVGKLRGEKDRLFEENSRLTRELEAAQVRLAETEDAGAEISALKEERDQIRARVGEMLDQLESLNL